MISTATPCYAQEYRIRLSLPDRPGNKYAISANAFNLERMSQGDHVLKDTEYRVEFEGHAEILGVDTKGQAVKIAFAVQRFVKTESGATTELLKPGATVLADDTRDEPLSLKDGPLSEEAREAFRLIHSRHKPGDPTDDEIFGTNEPKKIGESWAINSKLASTNLSEEGMVIPPAGISGTVKLIGQDRIDGSGCLDIRAEVSVDGVSVKDPPPGYTVRSAPLHAMLQRCFLMGDANLSYRGRETFTAEIHFTSSGGTIDVKFQKENEEVWKALGK